MEGYIYIASAFKSLKQCGCRNGDDVDNDPHIWSEPYTWGICRRDIRERVKIGDFVFFVLGSNANLPQMIFAYIRVGEIISHCDAYFRSNLLSKRMTGKRYDGNIIVDYFGDYNVFDRFHKDNFGKIKRKYVIADMRYSKILIPSTIKSKANDFVKFLHTLLNKKGKTPIEIISRYGQTLSSIQVKRLYRWLNN